MTGWRWVDLRVVHAVHDRGLAEPGGLAGMRDAGAVESALARPRNLAAYGKPDAAALAWVVARLFLADSGHRLWFDPADAVGTIEAVASGAPSEDALATWFRSRLAPAG